MHLPPTHVHASTFIVLNSLSCQWLLVLTATTDISQGAEGLCFSGPACPAGGCGPRAGIRTRMGGDTCPSAVPIANITRPTRGALAGAVSVAASCSKEGKFKYTQMWNCIQHLLMSLRDFYPYQARSLLMWLYHLFSLTCWYGNLLSPAHKIISFFFWTMALYALFSPFFQCACSLPLPSSPLSPPPTVRTSNTNSSPSSVVSRIILHPILVQL